MSLSDIELIIVGQIEHGHVLAVHSLNKQPGGGKVSWKQSHSFSEAPCGPVGKTLTHLTWSLKRTCADNLAFFHSKLKWNQNTCGKPIFHPAFLLFPNTEDVYLVLPMGKERKNTIKMKCHDRMLSTSTLSDQNMVRKYQFIYPKIQPNQSWKVIIFPQ